MGQRQRDEALLPAGCRQRGAEGDNRAQRQQKMKIFSQIIQSLVFLQNVQHRSQLRNKLHINDIYKTI